MKVDYIRKFFKEDYSVHSTPGHKNQPINQESSRMKNIVTAVDFTRIGTGLNLSNVKLWSDVNSFLLSGFYCNTLWILKLDDITNSLILNDNKN